MAATADIETNPRMFRFTTHPEDTPTGTCDMCDSLDGIEVEERLIGGAFPGAEQTDENSYDANVHKKCACTLELVEQETPTPENHGSQRANGSPFAYWPTQSPHEPANAPELGAQQPPQPETLMQYSYYAQPTFDFGALEKSFAEPKATEEISEKVAPKVARKFAKLAYWNPADSNLNAEEDPSQDGLPDEESDQDETFPEASEKLHLSPRRILHAARSIRGFQNFGLHAISGAGAVNPATAALATALIPLITELVRVEVELQLQAHNKQMEKDRNAEYRSAYASITPL